MTESGFSVRVSQTWKLFGSNQNRLNRKKHLVISTRWPKNTNIGQRIDLGIRENTCANGVTSMDESAFAIQIPNSVIRTHENEY